MSEKKLTDEEIVKAYKYCVLDDGHCDDCPYEACGCGISGHDIIDIINRQKAETERLEKQNEEQHNRIMELEQDLVHADENVFYRECDVALNEKKIANKALTEFAEKVVDEAFVVFMGEPIIRASKVRELLKEFTNEN